MTTVRERRSQKPKIEILLQRSAKFEEVVKHREEVVCPIFAEDQLSSPVALTKPSVGQRKQGTQGARSEGTSRVSGKA